MRSGRNKEHDMENQTINKRRAAYLLLVLGSVLVLVATWNLPENPAKQAQR